MKKIPEQKLQAFSVGAMGMRSLSKKEIEEQRKKEEDEATAHVFQEFVELFQEAPSKTSKVWVKAGTYDAGARKEDNSERGKLYKPQSRLSDANEKKASAEQVEEFTRSFASKPDKPTKKRDKDKKKSNLELFKEELRQIQEEREERHKYKGVLRTVLADANEIPAYAKDEPTMGSYDNGDPTTTNLYLGNLNPKVTEQQLMEIFGRYGPLASIKIMWPRSDEEKARGRNCGFVAFMARKDAERALRCINGKDIMSYEMKMGWGKALLIPACPIYIPPALQQPSQPPPQSGLPFNAQPPKHLANKIPRVRPGESYPTDPEDQKIYEQILSQSIVRVVIPTERNVLMMIHRMVEFVIREGPMFEAMIMNKEINNPFFRFLFENQSPAHVYYRWKLFSLLQGDSPKTWSLKDFRMFKGSSVWRPPILNMYTQGMPEDLVEEDEIVKDNRGTLSKTQRERLEELIRLLTPERTRVAEAMVFCMEHAEAAEEIADCLAESLSMLATAIHKKVARIYLISDILHNCGVKLTNASYFRKALERRLVQIMVDARGAWLSLEARLQREGFRARVLRVLGAWDHWAVYPKDFLRLLNDTFMGVENKVVEEGPEAVESGGEVEGTEDDEAVSETGSEEGGPLDGAALRRLAAAAPDAPLARAAPVTSAIAAAAAPLVDDIDGVPLDEDIDGVPLEGGAADVALAAGAWDDAGSVPGFVPSRWESVEPAQLQAQAVTTSQWELLATERRDAELPSPPSPPSPPTPAHSSHDSNQDWESRRALLRAVEVRALRYQDELEGGRRALRPGLTLHQQVQHYRRKLIKKAEREAKEKEEAVDSPETRVSEVKRVHHERSARSNSSEEGYTTSTSKKSKKSKEVSLSPPPKRSRHRSRSGERERDRGRGDRRRARSPSPAPSPPTHRQSSSSRRHKHKHKY